MLQLHDNSVTPLEAGFLTEEQAPSKQTQNTKQIIHSTGNPFSYPKEITATSSRMQRTSHQQPSSRSHNVLPIFQQPKMETPDICFVFNHQYMRDARKAAKVSSKPIVAAETARSPFFNYLLKTVVET